ncbi:MAG: NAD(P)-dependent alcohol dehydrogenase [Pleurocapsa sp. MO_226.B13]|nr:NAD(P)-dependent alcohol dehydrogenase [Pleurocapsa sp. MO_226.B13]
MKAIVLTKYGSPDDLKLQEVEKPTPQDDEVLIKVKATSINDWDWCIVRGKPFYIRLLCGFLKPEVQILGVDIAGEVVAVGKNVSQFKPGDRVYGDLSESGFGGFAEYVRAPITALSLMPKSISYIEAAAIPHAAMLALQGLRDLGKIQPGQKLLINGAGGGVGTLGVQIAKAIGVENITGVDRSNKLEMMRSLGFERTIDYQQEDFTQKERDYDLILDPKTNRSIFRYLPVLKPNGAYVTVGGETPQLLQALFLSPLIRSFYKKNVSILALKPNQDLDYINELFEAGQIKPVIDGIYKLNHTAKAIQHFGEGKHQGKVIITVENEL